MYRPSLRRSLYRLYGLVSTVSGTDELAVSTLLYIPTLATSVTKPGSAGVAVCRAVSQSLVSVVLSISHLAIEHWVHTKIYCSTGNKPDGFTQSIT